MSDAQPSTGSTDDRALSVAGRWRLALAFVVAQGVVVGLLLGPLWGQPWWQGFRRYFANDQLSYAAIATNVANGNLALVEPFTMTGSLYYPSLWYQLMGVVGLVTGIPVYLLWTLMGLTAAGLAVGISGWVAFRFSGYTWAPLLPALALLTGTYSVFVVDYWYNPVANHAVLWGPFGTLFTLNGEVAGLSLAAIAMCLLLLATRSTTHGRRRTALVLVPAAMVGLLANVQTYSFFTACSLTALFIATWSLLRYPSRRRLVTTAGLVVALLVLGGPLAEIAGPLPLFGLLLLALLPAVLPLVRSHPRLAVTAGALTAACAAPQVLRTMLGLAQEDPFLTYRQASTEGLGVPIGPALLAALPLLLAGALGAVALWRRSERSLSALLMALGCGVVVMASNDRWGFDQEPYRFWLQYAVLAALLLPIVLAWGLSQLRTMQGLRRGAFIGLAGATLVAWTVSLADVPRFWDFARAEGVVSAEDERAAALRGLLGDHDQLVISSSCLDPRVLKLISPGPVAFYNAGLAWPENELAFKTFQDAERRAAEIPDALRVAGVRFALTDSACETDWQFPADQSLLPVDTRSYTWQGQEEEFTLWLVQPS